MSCFQGAGMLGAYIVFLIASLILLAFVLLWFFKKEFLIKRPKLVLFIEIIVLLASLFYMIFYIYQHLVK